MELFSWTNCRD